MDDIERERERRRQKALERLGTDRPKCIFCDESDPHCLELHHIAGHKHGEETVIVCRNHHRKLSDKKHDHPNATRPGDPLERIGKFLLGCADLLEFIIRILREFGRDLIKMAQSKLKPKETQS
jgi:hypothetical protein